MGKLRIEGEVRLNPAVQLVELGPRQGVALQLGGEVGEGVLNGESDHNLDKRVGERRGERESAVRCGCLVRIRA